MHMTRRSFLSGLPIGAAGVAVGASMRSNIASAAGLLSEKATVSFVTGTDRRDAMVQALKPFEKQIAKALDGKRVLIKPNNVWDSNPLCATHPDAIRGVLDFLKPIYPDTVYVGESTASPKGTSYTFEEYGYLPIEREYNAKLWDLNTDGWTDEWIIGTNATPNAVKIINAFLDPDTYVISLARMKTHNCVLATLSLKNIAMASPINFPAGHKLFVSNQQEKAKMHEGGGTVGINWNLYQLLPLVRPDFCVIDGVEGMEGNGPANGTPVEHGIVLAGTDVVAVDRIGIELMGIDYADVAYLQWCANAGFGQGNRDLITVNGPDISAHVVKYRMNDNIDWQLEWKKGWNSG